MASLMVLIKVSMKMKMLTESGGTGSTAVVVILCPCSVWSEKYRQFFITNNSRVCIKWCLPLIMAVNVKTT